MSSLAKSNPATAPRSEALDEKRIRAGVRNSALDFSKGVLVLVMVLYHWLNYFHGPGDIYRYLRFLTPSFIFITGFLISNVHLSRYGSSDARLAKRLMGRGAKILVVFVFLNVAIALLFPHNGRVSFSLESFASTFVGGSGTAPLTGKAAAFPILVPIGYLLIISAGLVMLSRYYKGAFKLACGIFFLLVLVLRVSGHGSINVELLAIGSLGILFGYIPIENISAVAKKSGALLLAYVAYTAAITLWDVPYPLQVVGVCLTLVLIYGQGTRWDERIAFYRMIVTLGKYSLFGYVAQIALLYAIYKAFTHLGQSVAMLVLSFAAAFALTVVTVEAVDWARPKVSAVDWLYKLVFA
jgi:peptidoglycan/LPS O-acetylase OafA/YrhL